MIESIMDATKIEAGSVVVETELISLPRLLADTPPEICLGVRRARYV
ncbi:MAG TPA: hypothetical protein VH985_21735 [Candidatus Binatia bacterium]|jgi:hypothetical protein